MLVLHVGMSVKIIGEVSELDFLCETEFLENNWKFVLFQVGAPPEISCVLDGIRRENDVYKRDSVSTCLLGADPELDDFMVPPPTSLSLLI